MLKITVHKSIEGSKQRKIGWLCFETTNGKKAMLNLTNIANNSTTIVKSVLYAFIDSMPEPEEKPITLTNHCSSCIKVGQCNI